MDQNQIEANAEWRERAAERRASEAEEHLVVSEQSLRRIMREEINGAFTALGFDVSKPLQMQGNMRFLATLNRVWSEGGMKAVVTIVGLIVTAGFLAILVGLHLPTKFLALFGVKP